MSRKLPCRCLKLAVLRLGVPAITLTNSAGDVITNAVLVKLTANKFIYKTDTGMGMMPLESLSQDLQEKFGYDPQTAQAADDAEQAKKAREQQIVQQQRENAVQQTTGESYVSPYEGFCGKYSIVMATVEFTDAFKAAKDAQDQKKLGGF